MEVYINPFTQNYSYKITDNNLATVYNANIYFQAKTIKPKDTKKAAEAVKSYTSMIISKTAKVLEERICKDGTIVKYMDDGSILIQGTDKMVNPARSKITKSVTSSKEWKSSGGEAKSFEQASGHIAPRSQSTGIKTIDTTDQKGKYYKNRGCTHEVKVGENDFRLFGEKLVDGSYEWSFFEHSKLHKKGKR